MYAAPVIPKVRNLHRFRTLAPAGTYPLARAPHPPTRHLRVVEIGGSAKPLNPRCAFGDEPSVSSVQVEFGHRPVGELRHDFRHGGNGTPEVRNESVQIVDSFGLALPVLTGEQNRA